MGEYFLTKGTSMKMGDTPSLTRLLFGDPDYPERESWGGQFVPAWHRPHTIFHRLTTKEDSIEQFGVMELLLPFKNNSSVEPYAVLNIDRPIKGEVLQDTFRILFSPKNSSLYSYSLSSNIPDIDGLEGSIVAYRPAPNQKELPSPVYANWWTDDPSIAYIEKGYIGVKTVNRWRKDFLMDFAKRMDRCLDDD